MKSVLFIWLTVTLSTSLGQTTVTFTNTLHNLFKASAQPDSSLRKREILQRWAEARAMGIPMVSGDSTAFLYRGEAKSVAWMGDFNGWGYDKEFNNMGIRIPGSDIWVLKCSFPLDARLDYKILLKDQRCQ
jgi:hypothetical protein